ncbi:hypothetical protein [Merdibacter massiliensis]|uniref:hypothetical protein n=1 Tax=Merdibacter massiliensis TaxID=1871030 RepID=UPI00192A5990|nr:hypothetical protein [Merdibacter massiliensis]
MKYVMKSGSLMSNGQQLVYITGSLVQTDKKVVNKAGTVLLELDIVDLETENLEEELDHQYVMYNKERKVILSAFPAYAENNRPSEVGWPVCRMPKVDHAIIKAKNSEYTLQMLNNQNYCLYDIKKEIMVQIYHRGIGGGWNIETKCQFEPEILCGLFVFCKYLEKENEFLIV